MSYSTPSQTRETDLAEPPLKSPRATAKTPERKAPRPRAIGAAAVREWDFMRSRLAPIIGEDGFRILFARSLHRARVDHPWLAREALQPDKPFSSLKTSLESQPPERAAQGNRTLGTHFDALVHALIGKALADRLLAAPIVPLRRANQEKNP